MTTKTEHQLRLDAEEQERTDATEVHRRRLEILRVCPVGQALDREHVVTLISQDWSSNVVYRHARRFVAAGMRSHGYSARDVARALGVQPDDVEAIAARVVWWDPPAELLASLREDLRGRVVGPR